MARARNIEFQIGDMVKLNGKYEEYPEDGVIRKVIGRRVVSGQKLLCVTGKHGWIAADAVSAL